MQTIFNYALSERLTLEELPYYEVSVGTTEIGVLEINNKIYFSAKNANPLIFDTVITSTVFLFYHHQSGAKIEFSLPNSTIKENPLLGFEKQLARIASSIYPPLMAHLTAK